MKPRDWDAETYDRVATPQLEWARSVLARLELDGDETVLDAGCGTGTVSRMLADRLPGGRVIGVDSSPSMAERAREALRPQDEVLVADLTDLELEGAVDVVFSNAVFHWVLDQDALFGRLRAALRPRGRLIAQCGGKGNLDRFLAVVDEVAAEPRFAEALRDFEQNWRFAGAEETEERLRRAGFDEVRAWLEPSPVKPADPAAFVSTVVLGSHLDHLPDELGTAFVEAVLARAGDPVELGYVRLNIDASVG